MAKAMGGQGEWAQSGCHILHFSSPACLLIPADTPFSDGSVPHWENPDVPPPTTKLFWIDQMSKWVLCHICSTQGGVHKSEHSLKVQDEDVIALIGLLTGELRRRAARSKTIANNYLGALLHCLQRRLTHDIPVIANTVHLPPPEIVSAEQPTAADRIIATADEFVHSYLGEPITLPEIAKYCGVSPTHLNRVFQARLGISAKRFIYRQRIRSAQRILTESDLPIKEVASLVGFSHASHFCRVFQRDAKLSPTEFRAKHRTVNVT
jgi:AraC-like DNA-binding protein